MGFPPGYNKQLVLIPSIRSLKSLITFRKNIIKSFLKNLFSSSTKKFKKSRKLGKEIIQPKNRKIKNKIIYLKRSSNLSRK